MLVAVAFVPEAFLLPAAWVLVICWLLARLYSFPLPLGMPFGKPSDIPGNGEGVEVLRSVLGERAAFCFCILKAARYSVKAAVIIGLLLMDAMFGIWLKSFRYC